MTTSQVHVIWLQLTIAWPSTLNHPQHKSLRLTHFLPQYLYFVILTNYLFFSTLLLGCWLGVGELFYLFSSGWVASAEIFLWNNTKWFFIEWLISYDIHYTCQHSLLRYKWTLKSFKTVKISQSHRRICKTQVLFVPRDVQVLNRKWNHLICSLPISIFLLLLN